VAVVQIPCIRVDGRLRCFMSKWVPLLCDVQTTEDEVRFNLETAERSQVFLDVLRQGQRKASECGDERFFCARVIKNALIEIFGGFNAYTAAAHVFEVAQLAEGGRPLHEIADHGASRVWNCQRGSKNKW